MIPCLQALRWDVLRSGPPGSWGSVPLCPAPPHSLPRFIHSLGVGRMPACAQPGWAVVPGEKKQLPQALCSKGGLSPSPVLRQVLGGRSDLGTSLERTRLGSLRPCWKRPLGRGRGRVVQPELRAQDSWVSRANHLVGTVLSVSDASSPPAPTPIPLDPLNNPEKRACWPLGTEEQAAVLRGQVICPRSHSFLS